MTGEERRAAILVALEKGAAPLSGSGLAKQFDVSRQVIVQDIALLRANNKNILSTNKGYVLFREHGGKAQRVFQVSHTDKQILDEFYAIVDYGAKVLDVIIEHEIYGQIAVDLVIQNRADAMNFCKQLENTNSKTLNILTGGVHFHTVEADNEAILDQVEAALEAAGLLVY